MRRRKLQLYARCKYCFWCGCETVIIEGNKSHKNLPDNCATVDHIRSRMFETRKAQDENWHPGLTVLACIKCNNARGKYEEMFLREINEEAFYQKGNTRPSETNYKSLHHKISNVALKLLEYIHNDEYIERLINNHGVKARILWKKLRDSINDLKARRERDRINNQR